MSTKLESRSGPGKGAKVSTSHPSDDRSFRQGQLPRDMSQPADGLARAPRRSARRPHAEGSIVASGRVTKQPGAGRSKPRHKAVSTVLTGARSKEDGAHDDQAQCLSLGLPLELWQRVADSIDLSDKVALSISNKSFYKAFGKNDLHKLCLPVNHIEKVKFLFRIFKDLPSHWLCSGCAIYHCTTADSDA